MTCIAQAVANYGLLFNWRNLEVLPIWCDAFPSLTVNSLTVKKSMSYVGILLVQWGLNFWVSCACRFFRAEAGVEAFFFASWAEILIFNARVASQLMSGLHTAWLTKAELGKFGCLPSKVPAKDLGYSSFFLGPFHTLSSAVPAQCPNPRHTRVQGVQHSPSPRHGSPMRAAGLARSAWAEAAWHGGVRKRSSLRSSLGSGGGVIVCCAVQPGASRRLWRAAARVCREAGAIVATNILLRDLNVVAAHQNERRLEVIANGLPLWGGVQLAVDTTLVSQTSAIVRNRPQASAECRTCV